MQITPMTITVRELTENYIDDGDGGVVGYNHRLVIRPAYQREFIYKAKHHATQYNSNTLEADMKRLLMDDDVTKKAGVVPYLLSPRAAHDERNLLIRAFTESQKRRAYERQGGRCAGCGQHFEFEDMQGDHITPWCQGGRTVDDNLQMLCRTCNSDKGGD